MTSALTLVVGGAPAMAQALSACGRFDSVHAIASTGELRDLVGSGQLPSDKNRMVFLFADDMRDDTGSTPLATLVGKLVRSDRRVVILGITPNAHSLVATHRQAGLLTGPFTLNATLGAIAGLGLQMVEPVDGPAAYEQFHPVTGPVPDVTSAPAQPAAPAWGQTAPAAQPAPAAAPQPAPQPSGGWASGGGWGSGTAGEEWGSDGGAGSASPAWGEPAEAPQQPTPAAQPQQPAPSSGGGTSLADVAAARSLADVAGGTSLADVAGDQPPAQTEPTPPDTGGWESGGGWESVPAEPQPAAPADGPVGRGGLTVQHNQLRKRRGWVITISSPKGGTGKTSLSTNLAAFLALQLRAEGKTVCLIDANYGQADVGKIIDRYSPNIVDMARDTSVIHPDHIMQHLVHKPDLNLSVLLGPASPKDANPVYITPQLYNQVLDVLQTLFDYLIIDTQVAERFSTMHSDFSIPRADRLIVPVNPNLATLMNADAWLRSICEPAHSGGIGYREDQVGILLNMAMEGVDCDVDDVMRELGSWTFVGDIPLTPIWQKALNNNDIVATYNYEELNVAFARVLYAATGEQVLAQMAPGISASTPDAGIGQKVKGWLRKVMA